MNLFSFANMREHATHLIYQATGWWGVAAQSALRQGHYNLIGTRHEHEELYLARFWLTPPAKLPDGTFDSGNSVLLHAFARGDDDQALHDHPWNFRTTILQGWYEEHLVPLEWTVHLKGFAAEQGFTGPPWDERIETRNVSESVIHQATDLHCIGKIAPYTWSLVVTESRHRSWGFYPPGQPWIGWREYLGKMK